MSRPLRERSFSEDEPIKVSICSIAFNHRDFIEDCLDGFLAQVCDFRIEIIIYDDASTDGTAEIIRMYADRHPTIFRTILKDENLYSRGVNPYYGFVLPAALGEFVAFCDGDDFWSDPDKIAKQVAVMEAEPDIALTYGPVQAVDAKGTVRSYEGGATRNLNAAELKAGPAINTLTACFRNIFRDAPISLFARTSTIGDLTVWAMLGHHGNGRFMSDLLPANYRVHDKGLISMQSHERQLFMTAICHFHIAAYHSENADRPALEESVRTAIQFYNQIGYETIGKSNIPNLPPASLFRLWIRSLGRKIRNRSN